MNALFLGSIFRHLLTAGGGATAVTADDPFSPQAIAGAIATLIGFVLSIYEKRKRNGG